METDDGEEEATDVQPTEPDFMETEEGGGLKETEGFLNLERWDTVTWVPDEAQRTSAGHRPGQGTYLLGA